MQIDKKTLRYVFIGAITCIVLYWILHDMERVQGLWAILTRVFSPFFIGASFAFIINVPMRAIEGRLMKINKPRVRRLLAIALTLICVLLVVGLVFALLIPELVDTIKSLVVKLENFPSEVEISGSEFLAKHPKIMEWLQNNTNFEEIDWSDLVQNLLSSAGNGMTSLVDGAFSAIGGIADAFMDAFISVVFCVYCLVQKETLARQGRKLLYAFLPEKVSDQTVRILRLTNSTFSNFLSGQCLEVCILGCLFAISMAIFRMPYIPLVSVLVAVTAFIPVVGAWAGCIIGAFFILVANPAQAFWFVIMFIVLQQIENNLIYPRVVGTSIGLSGMWVLVAVGVGGELGGVAGMFLMIPVASVIYTLIGELTNNRLANKALDPQKLQPQPPELRKRMRLFTRRKKTNADQNNDK